MIGQLNQKHGIIGSYLHKYIIIEKARTLPELSVKTLEEWRIWLELKRIQPEIKVLLAEANLDTYSQVKGFELDGMQLCVEDGEIIIRKGKKIERVTKQEFLYNLRGVLKRLQY